MLIQWVAYEFRPKHRKVPWKLSSFPASHHAVASPPPPGLEEAGTAIRQPPRMNHITTLSPHESSPHLTQSLCLTSLSQFIQDGFYNHSFRLRPLGPIPHPRSIAHNILFHRGGHPNLPRLHNTHCSYNNHHIQSSSIHNDPRASTRCRNTYIHYHSTRRRNLIDTRSTPSVHSSRSAICCARPRSPSGC